ncbi:MAG: ABC transporter permease [Clostridiales bacterium]|uniref:ABC transporter permease n=1 Tax=Clostridium sp. N3C TaxID=1776758 RepID=UPI00092DFD1A|nr:ABC transporter permease [Clostridium sp. N3C]NLZ49958.1 ABC transporter permease [Clostridiales bacterium]SCN22713.1 ABC-type uncharacterized transport system, permease component [Clostridium sp. N3C]
MNALEIIVPLAITYTVPLFLIALGGLFSERSGVINIALEGLLGIGAFASAFVIFEYESILGASTVYVSLIAAAVAGGLCSLLHAFASISMKADQVVSGTAINILVPALTIFLARSINKGSGIIPVKGLELWDVPILSKIPIIGSLFFHNTYTTTFISIIIVIISWYVLYYRPFGLRLRACGENPQAVDSVGISVVKMRYIGVIISGILSGLGGGLLLNTLVKEFSTLIFTGLGFLALAALIFGKWKPWSVLGASAFFGLAKTVSDIAPLFSGLNQLPSIFLTTFPYVITIIALVLFSKNAVGPKAAGEPYDVGKR